MRLHADATILQLTQQLTAVEAQCAALQQERDTAVTFMNQVADESVEYRAQLIAEREAQQALQAALLEFGKHKQGCEAYVWAGLPSAKAELCTCGLDAALHASEGAPK